MVRSGNWIIVFPHFDEGPARFCELFCRLGVSPTIGIQLLLPPFLVGFWQGSVRRAPVPEAPSYLDDNSRRYEHDVMALPPVEYGKLDSVTPATLM